MHEAGPVFNTMYCWRTRLRVVGPLFLVRVPDTTLDFAMHFVITLA